MPGSWKIPSGKTLPAGSGAIKGGRMSGRRNIVDCCSISNPMARAWIISFLPMYYFFYGLLYLVSLLPMRILYLLSDGIYGLLYYAFKYRRDVVMGNLLIAFPALTEEERVRIAKKFYHNFIDSFIEVIKLLS